MDFEVRKYEFSLSIKADFVPEVTHQFFKLRVLPCANSSQAILSQCLQLSPTCKVNHSIDGFGNFVQYGSYADKHDFFLVESNGVVVCHEYKVRDNGSLPIYATPSALTQYDDAMYLWAKQATVGCSDNRQKAFSLMHAVHDHVAYCKSSTENTTTAKEVFVSRKGVCQDFAHVMIAACRSLGIPARYVNGLVLGEGATHAWVEVFFDGYWYGYDPTLDCLVLWGYVKIAHGRDVSDCPTNRGQIFGNTKEIVYSNANLKLVI